MSKLTDFYAHKANMQEEEPKPAAQWELLEDQLIREELLPELLGQLKATLSQVKSPLMLNVSYAPNGALAISFTRNCIQAAIPSAASQAVVPNEQEEESNGDSVAEGDEFSEQSAEEQPQRSSRAKSVGFSVSFRDGTVIHERKAVNTWILALQKIGLENICNNRRKHHAWHRVNGQDICIVERTETIRDSDGKSPQTLVDGFYVMTQLSNDQKEKDLLALGDYLPKLGIKVTWDDETEEDNYADEPAKTPTVNEDASHWNYPTKEQFRSYMARAKSEGTARTYTSALDNVVREWINREVDGDADSVFSYTTAEDVRLCIEMLNASPEYVAENERKHHAMSAALNQYLQFIEEWEKITKE